MAGAPVVIAYHSVHPQQDGVRAPDVITDPADLEREVRGLLAASYRCVTADELVTETGGRRPPERTALLTFDDGWLDGLSVATPLLASLGVRATFFVCPGLWSQNDERMGTAGRVMSATQADDLHAAGMDLGAHSMTHPDLRTLEDGALAAELEGSKAAVEAVTGRPCRTFAYPFGLHDARVRLATARAGFTLAFGYRPAAWNRLAAPRRPAT